MTQTQSKQIWPGGRTMTYRRDERDGYTVKDGESWRDATEDETKAIRIEELAERLLETDVYCCDSCLVGDAMKLADCVTCDTNETYDFVLNWSWDKVSNLRPDPSDWTLEQCKEWLEDQGHDFPDLNPWSMDRNALAEELGHDSSGEEIPSEDDMRAELIKALNYNRHVEGLEDWRDAVRDNATDAEIYEWWRVSPWLAEKLDDAGECVLENDYGCWWGRTCTGQSVIMDGTFQTVAWSILGDGKTRAGV